MDKVQREKWRRVKRMHLISLVVGMILGGALSYYLWGATAALATEGAALCLALGFWLTEMLIGVFTQVKTANGTAIGLIFFGKLAWWGSIFYAAKHMPKGLEQPLGLGFGIFLFALVAAALNHFGMPRISDANPPSDP